jgi:hypothetical protein
MAVKFKTCGSSCVVQVVPLDVPKIAGLESELPIAKQSVADEQETLDSPPVSRGTVSVLQMVPSVVL